MFKRTAEGEFLGGERKSDEVGDVLPNASLIEPPLAKCASLRDDAAKMLKQVWSEPNLLGENSDHCKTATLLYKRIRQYCTPRQADDVDAHNAFREALRLSWLAVWRARDYSIEGTIRRAEERNWGPNYLQALRNMNSSFVHVHEGVRWLHAHYPMFGSGGQAIPSVKRHPINSYWPSSLGGILEGAIVTHAEQLTGRQDSNLRWSLIQAQLPDEQRGWKLDHCYVNTGSTAFSYQTKAISSLANTVFAGPVTLSNFSTHDLKPLENARFESGLRLTKGEFTRPVELPSIETGPELTLDDVRCQDRLTLHGAKGITYLNWRGLRDVGRLSLTAGRSISVRIQGVSNNTQRVEALTGVHGLFKSLTISDLQGAIEIDFSAARFEDDVSVQGLTTMRAVSLKNCRFSGLVTVRADFQHSVEFYGTRFERSVIFRGTRFTRASFEGVEFLGAADFDDAAFLNSLNFRQARFLHLARFSAGSDAATQFPAVTFESAEFADAANFRNRHFKDDTSFDLATFKRPPSFHGATFHPRTSFTGAQFKWKASRQSLWWDRAVVSRVKSWLRQKPSEAVQTENAYLQEVSDAFRVLSSLAKKIDSPELAFAFHKEELRGKHHRGPGAGVARPEAVVGRVYGWLADYGDSFLRPIVWLLLSFAVFGCAYSAISTLEAKLGAAPWLTSASIQLKPFSHLDAGISRVASEGRSIVRQSTTFGASPTTTCLAELNGDEHLSAFCMMVHLVDKHEAEFNSLATVQSILSLLFLFLAALGLRRKFQVS